MRHSVSGYRLGRTAGARVALRRNLIKQFFIHERIQTTRAKANAIRGEAERLITIARNSAEGDDAIEAGRIEVEGIRAELLAPHGVATSGRADGPPLPLRIAERLLKVVDRPWLTDFMHPRRVQLRLNVVHLAYPSSFRQDARIP